MTGTAFKTWGRQSPATAHRLVSTVRARAAQTDARRCANRICHLPAFRQAQLRVFDAISPDSQQRARRTSDPPPSQLQRHTNHHRPPATRASRRRICVLAAQPLSSAWPHPISALPRILLPATTAARRRHLLTIAPDSRAHSFLLAGCDLCDPPVTAIINPSPANGAAGAYSPPQEPLHSAPPTAVRAPTVHAPVPSHPRQPSPSVHASPLTTQGSPSTLPASPLSTPRPLTANGAADGRQAEPARMRSQVACTRCRTSKIRCVNRGFNTDCDQCIKSQRNCSYTPSNISSGTSKRRDSNVGAVHDGPNGRSAEVSLADSFRRLPVTIYLSWLACPQV